MHDQAGTIDIHQPKKQRGRPVTGQAKSNADRQRAYRQRLKNRQEEQKSGIGAKNPLSRLEKRLENLEKIILDLSGCNQALQQQIQNLSLQLDSGTVSQQQADHKTEISEQHDSLLVVAKKENARLKEQIKLYLNELQALNDCI